MRFYKLIIKSHLAQNLWNVNLSEFTKLLHLLRVFNERILSPDSMQVPVFCRLNQKSFSEEFCNKFEDILKDQYSSLLIKSNLSALKAYKLTKELVMQKKVRSNSN